MSCYDIFVAGSSSGRPLEVEMLSEYEQETFKARGEDGSRGLT